MSDELSGDGGLSASLANALTQGAGATLDANGSTHHHTYPYYPYPYQYTLAYPSLAPDEELLLNAIRRDPKVKDRVLRVALEEVLRLLNTGTLGSR